MCVEAPHRHVYWVFWSSDALDAVLSALTGVSGHVVNAHNSFDVLVRSILHLANRCRLNIIINHVNELLLELADDVVSLNLFYFGLLVLLNEFVNAHVPTTNTNKHLAILLNFDIESL